MDGNNMGKLRQLDQECRRKKDDTKISGDKSAMKPKTKLIEIDDPLHVGTHLSNRHHQGEVPPRFQLQKQCKTSTRGGQAVTKKQSKDTPRWNDPHTRTPSQDHTHSNSADTSDDGGWSTGQPAKGSGWRKANSESSDWSNKSWDDGTSGWEGKPESDGWSHNGHLEGGWASDEASSRSQSPGGIVMIVKQQTTPSKENSNTWESKTVGSNWKMHTLDTKPTDEAEKKSGWSKLESCETDSANHRESFCEGMDKSTVFSQDQDGSPTKALSQNNLSGKSTPTQEMGGAWRSGRTSAQTVSPQSEIDGRRNSQVSRSSSPRKMNRYDQTNNSNTLGCNAGLILPRPRKSLAELEGGLDSLHSAPSGWGEPPSPKDNVDNGTEFWGIPPDDLARMEQPTVINGWSGGSRSPHSKPLDYSADSANWSSNENIGKPGWRDEKLPHNYDNGTMTPSSLESHSFPIHHSGVDMTTPPIDTSYPQKAHKWNMFDEQKEHSFQPINRQQQFVQNSLMVKELSLHFQQVSKLLGQPSSNLQSIQKTLSQQLSQAQQVRQRLLAQVTPPGLASLSAQHPLKGQLAHTNDIITQLKQQIDQSHQMLSQQNSIFAPRMRPPGYAHFSDGNADLAYNMRDMSLSQRTQGMQQSRSMSKLQRIISSQEDHSESSYGANPSSSSYNSSSPFSPPFRVSSATSSMTSSSLASKPVHQIQEFKPGVPWQSRKTETAVKHPDQLFSSGVQRSMSQSFGQQQGRFGGQRFTRSMSTDNNFYNNQVPPPVRNDHPWANTDSRPQNFSGRSWNSGQKPGRISLPSTPVGMLPEQTEWRQHPTTLIPSPYQRRGSRTPLDTHNEWLPETPTSADPVWGPGQLEQGMWPKSGRGWSQSESIPTPSSERGWPERTLSEWPSGEKVKSNANLNGLSPWLVIRSNSLQLNMQGLKDTCKGFGDIKSLIEGSECILVNYATVEEAVQAKSHVDGLWGRKAFSEVVPEGELETIWQQITEPRPKVNPPSSLHPSLFSDSGRSNVFKWEDPKAFSYSPAASTPSSSSVWSDGGFLSGISSPWSELSGTLTSPSTGYQSDEVPSVTATPEDRSTAQGTAYLPNGLF